MKRILLSVCLLLATTSAMADIMADLSVGYHSREVNGYESSIMEFHGFLGMPVAVKDQLYLGLNASIVSESNGENFSSTEFGVRVNYYMNADKNYLVILGYNPFVSAETHYVSGATNGNDKPSGHSYIAGLGYEMKLNNNFYIGTSVIYHAITLESDGTTDRTYNSLNPMVNFCFRFR